MKFLRSKILYVNVIPSWKLIELCNDIALPFSYCHLMCEITILVLQPKYFLDPKSKILDVKIKTMLQLKVNFPIVKHCLVSWWFINLWFVYKTKQDMIIWNSRQDIEIAQKNKNLE